MRGTAVAPSQGEASVLTLSALLLGVTAVTPSPTPPEAGTEIVAPAFDARPPTLPPLARRRSDLRDPFAAPKVAAAPLRKHSDLRDPFAARARAHTDPSYRSADIKAPF
jgi:hypothetical protein